MRSIKLFYKFSNFCTNVSLCSKKPDIIVLTETWLNEVQDDALYKIDGYTIHRSDRHDQIGGGCLIAVTNSLISTPITMPDNGVEHLFVKVTNRHEKFIVGAAYMPPGCSINNYIAHTEVVESLAARFSSYKLALFGDYNLAGIKWSMNNNYNLIFNTDDSASREISDKAICIGNSFGTLQLGQYHPVLASGKTYTLDLCFSNFEHVVYEEPLEILSKVDSHHPPAAFSITIKQNTGLNYSIKYKNFRKANYEEINRKLSDIDWDTIFAGLDCEAKVDKFYKILDKEINLHVPLVNKTNNDFPSWFRHELKSFIFQKNRAHWIYKLSHSPSDYTEFKRLRAICIRKRNECYAVYVDKVQSSSKFNIKSFWSFVNFKRNISISLVLFFWEMMKQKRVMKL